MVGAAEWGDVTESDGSGIYFQLLNRIYGKENLHIKLDTYNRNIKSFNEKKLDLIVGVFREDINEAILPHWFLDVDEPILAFYQAKHTKINELSDLDKYSNSWIRGYHFERFLLNAKHQYLVNSTTDGFNLLAHNRTDTFIDYLYNVPEELANSFAHFEILPARHLYVAFQNNEHGKALAKQFDNAMAELRKTGELAEIYGDLYAKSTLASFNDYKEKMLILTDEINLIKGYKNGNITFNDTLNRSLRLIFNQLDEYIIEFQLVENFSNISRFKDSENVCISDMLKTPAREQDFIFSQPSSLYLGLQLYSKTALINNHGEINLLTLFQNAEHQLGVVQGRSYGVYIDQFIAQLSPEQAIGIPVKLDRIAAGFANNRFDLLIEYPQDINLHWQQISQEPLFTYNIENATQYNVGHMMCSNTKTNAEFIKKFNTIVNTLAKNGELLEVLSSSVPLNNKPQFREYFKDVFLKN